ncbi:MAG TPA: RDD family protein [Pseudobdellovibrionaceae bacterium]|nr:RDD family protein [Pseudobdellovibrionaceae bacterium]
MSEAFKYDPNAANAVKPQGSGAAQQRPDLNLVSSPTMKMEPAGFWIRWLATIVDGVIVNLVSFPLGFAMGFASVTVFKDNATMDTLMNVLSQVIGIAVTVAYVGYFTSRKGATLGKLAFGMRVYKEGTTQHLSFGKAVVREFAKIASYLTLLIGFIMAGVRKDKRALHDLLAGTRVVRVNK